MTDRDYMKKAIAITRVGLEDGQTPFGACIVKDGRIVAAAHNRVWARNDITAHAEVECIRDACLALRTIDLSGCAIYSTCEPCPMCFCAIHWARLDHLYYGATIADAHKAGFHELHIGNQMMKEIGGSDVIIHPPIYQAECAALFDEWLKLPGRKAY